MSKIKDLIDNRPMTTLQYSTIFVCFLMNMLDGMDVMIISYTAPAIAKAWSMNQGALGIVISAGLFGMTLGTFLLAPFADKIGRKNIILMSGLLMGTCVYYTSYAESLTALLIYRFISGLGIGCMLASTASLTAEYAPNRSKDFWVSLVLSGYAVGALISGLVAARVIPEQGWQAMYKLAGSTSLLSIPIVFFFLSESLDFYLKTQPKNALSKVNYIINKMDGEPISQLPEKYIVTSKIPVDQLLKSEFRQSTFQLWIALFMAFAALYFLTGWIPKLAKDAGLSMSLAIYAGAVFNAGAFLGILTQGYFSSKFGLKKTISVILTLTAILMTCFGLFVGSDWVLAIFALIGFGIQGGFVGLYSVAARLYPTEFRTTGVGWAMGAGRIGGIVGPILAGYLLQAGVSISVNFIIFAVPTIVAAYFTYNLASKKIS
jgi:MFS transporter, AAHS family, 4-hydroxybenzoate transporter